MSKTLSFGFDIDVRRFRPERPPVLLLGGGLNLLRPLGFAGIPAIVASPYPREPALSSRYCNGRCLLPPLHEQEAVVETLLVVEQRLASTLGCRIPLFYGNDDHLNLIYSFREQLTPRFLLLLNEPDVARALIDKNRFEALARDRGLAVPRTLTWDDTGPGALSRADGPVLVKPKVKVGWDDSAIHLRLFGGEGKARVFKNGREVMAHPLASQLKEQLTFQPFIPGGDDSLWSFHGYADERGQLLAWFVGHARFNLWHHMAAKNGVNLPQVAYDYLVHGTRAAGTRYRTTFRWLYFRLDVRAFRELASRGELGLGGWLASLARSRKVYDLFSWTDPAPWLRVGGERVISRLRRWLNHLEAGLRRWLSTAL